MKNLRKYIRETLNESLQQVAMEKLIPIMNFDIIAEANISANGELKDFDFTTEYPYDAMWNLIKNYVIHNKEHWERFGWSIFDSYGSQELGIKYKSENGSVFRVEKIDQFTNWDNENPILDVIDTDEEAYEKAREAGFIINDDGVVFGLNGVNLFDTNYVENITEENRLTSWKSDIEKVASKLGVSLTKFIGGGVWGIAYEIKGNKVIKITEDDREVESARSLVGKHNILLADIYEFYSIKGSDKKVIILEKLQPLTKEYEKALDVFDGYFSDFYNFEWPWAEIGERGYQTDFDNNLKSVKYDGIPLTDIYSELLHIMEEANSNGIQLTDIHAGNLGIKNGKLAAFDLS